MKYKNKLFYVCLEDYCDKGNFQKGCEEIRIFMFFLLISYKMVEIDRKVCNFLKDGNSI